MYYLCARHVIDMTMSIFVTLYFKWTKRRRKKLLPIELVLFTVDYIVLRESDRDPLFQTHDFFRTTAYAKRHNNKDQSKFTNRHRFSCFFFLVVVFAYVTLIWDAPFIQTYMSTDWNIVLTCNMNNLYTSFFFCMCMLFQVAAICVWVSMRQPHTLALMDENFLTTHRVEWKRKTIETIYKANKY